MDISALKKKLLNKKTQDYTYAIAFFLIFSFFIFYIIRPNLITVFEIKTKIEKLKEINNLYGKQIDKIIEIQSKIESNREDFVILKEAIAEKPEVNKMLSDIDVSLEENKLQSDSITVSDINLKDTGSLNKQKSLIIDMDLLGTFSDTTEFIKKIYSQRRLKYVPSIELSQENETSDSAKLKIKLEIEGFYL